MAMEERPGYDKEEVRMKVALGGPVGSKALGPRELASSSLRRLVCVEGVAVKVSSELFLNTILLYSMYCLSMGCLF